MRTKRFALLSALILLLAHGLNAQTINTLTTIAGGGSPVGDGVAATSATFNRTQGTAIDAAGNVYVADWNNHRIRKIDAVTGLISTVAGNGSQSYSGDGGLAINASLNQPTDVAVDAAGNLYISDYSNQRIRKVTASTGIITTIGGDGTAAFNNTGKGQFNNPLGIAVDTGGNVYVADGDNHRIRKITPAGVVSTITGNGTATFSGDGAAATNAKLNYPADVALDAAGNIYIADLNNHRIRKITVATGIISTVAGSPTGGTWAGDGGLATSASLNYPRGVTIDASGNIYIADNGNARVRKVTTSTGIITTVAGDGVGRIAGNGGLAVGASFYSPWGINVDASGNLYITDETGQQIRKVTASTGNISLFAGFNVDGSSTPYYYDSPQYKGFGGLATKCYIDFSKKPFRRSNGDVFFATQSVQNSTVIAKIDAVTGILSQVYGAPTGGTYPNTGAFANQTALYADHGIVMDTAGNVYFSEGGQSVVRKITASTGVITNVIGTPGTTGSSNTGVGAVSTPKGVAVDAAGNVYVADYDNHCIRKITPAGVKTTVAGVATAAPTFAGDNGQATAAKLNNPTDVVVDASGNLYIMDAGNYRIRKVTASTGVITTIAGNGNNTYGGNANGDGGLAFAAALSHPEYLVRDSVGNIYFPVVGGDGSNGVRKIDAATGIINPVIDERWDDGDALTLADGTDALKTGLDEPNKGLFVDASGLYVGSSSRLRKLIPATGNTIAVGTNQTSFDPCYDSVANAIPYFATGTFNSGNVFMLQLSDATGSFTGTPTTLGTLTNTVSGTIQATFPTNLMSSNLYRIRVVSSNPVAIGAVSNQTYNLPRITAINQPDSVNLCAGTSVTLTSLSGTTSTSRTYQWVNAATSANIANATGQSYTATATGQFRCYVSDANNGCPADYSRTIAVTSRAIPAIPTITPNTAQTICQGSSVTLTRNVVASTNYQWTQGAGVGTPTTPGGTLIPNATGVTYPASPAVTDSFRVVAINTFGCMRTSAAVRVNVNPAPSVVITPSGPTTFCNGGSVTLSVPTGANSYQWSNNGTAITTGGNTASLTVTTAGSYTVTATGSNSCSATSAATVVTVNSCVPVITSLSPARAVCQGGTIAVAFSSNATFNSGNVFTAQLSDTNGVFGATPTSIGTLTATAAGTINATIGTSQLAGTRYRIRVVSSNPVLTGAANDSNITVNALATVAQTTISPTTATTLCAGGSVTLSVPTGAGSYQWRVGGVNVASNGTSASYLATPSATSTYACVVTTTAGCARLSANKVVTVNALPTATITPSTTQNLCGAGASVTFSVPAGATTYVWRNNGTAISGAANANTYTATAAGVYSVVVTNSNNCSATSAGVTVTASCGVAITDTGVRAVCSGTGITANFSASGFGAGNVFTLQMSDASGSFTNTTPVNLGTLTATSATSMTATIPVATAAGNGYKLRINTSNPATTGNASPLTVLVRNSLTTAQQLCRVDMDSALSKNKLIWNKPTTLNIDSFVFYRQNDVATYSRIGAQAYSVFSTYTDTSSIPVVEAQRYYMTAKNGCGESPVGTAHRTMHLALAKGLNNNTTCILLWNSYEGAAHTYYNIYRGTTTTNLAWIGSVPFNTYNSFTDLNMPAGVVYYRVSTGDAPACTPSKGAVNAEEIFSNIVSTGVGLAINWMEMGVYPNPSAVNGTLLIESSRMDEVYEVRITDITGRVVEQLQTVPGKENSFGAALAPGLYLVEAASDGGKRQVKKWTKN